MVFLFQSRYRIGKPGGAVSLPGLGDGIWQYQNPAACASERLTFLAENA
jgi:hypothetical protein